MKLERTLIELAMLVDYGTKYLLDLEKARFQGEEMGRDMVCDLSIGEFMELNDLSDYDVLDSLSGSSIKEYVYNEFDADELFDAEDMLCSIDMYDIKDYISNNYDVADFIDWR